MADNTTPMKRALRSRQKSETPTKAKSTYDDIVETPISKDNGKRRTRSKDSIIEHLPVSRSPSPSTSNAENEGTIGKLQNTPRKSSRLRANKNFTFTPSINDETKSITAVFRSVPASNNENTPTSANRRQPQRQSISKRIMYREDSASDENSGVDDDNFTPDQRFNLERSSDDETTVCEDEDASDEESDYSAEDSGVDDPSDKNPRELFKQQDLLLTPSSRNISVAYTPELLKKLEGRSVKSRMAVDSPVSVASHTMSPNPEVYFLASNRLKFKRRKAASEAVMNDAMKGKGRGRKKRKLIRSIDSHLPEKISSDFSVTAEASKAVVDSKNFISGNTHEEEVEALMENIIGNEMPRWIGLFMGGFNVMLYGYGSKLQVLREFEKKVNEDYLVVSINGLFPKLNARKLLYGICEFVCPDEKMPHSTSLEAVAQDVASLLKTKHHPDVFLLVNNFDNLALRVPSMLTVLCRLSQVPYIRILATCDTINACLGVSQSQFLQLSFCWMHCPTYKQYREELKWIPGIYGDETKIVTQKSSLKYVLQSLTSNARKAFSRLAQMQLKQLKNRSMQKSKDSYSGVRFQELAKVCRENFIAHSDENLRTLLVEFFDHKLIKQTGKGRHLENLLLIELDIETLEEVIIIIDL